MTRKWLIGAALLGLAVGWVAAVQAMSAIGHLATPQSVPAKDGSKAVIKFVDKSRFKIGGEVSLRIEITDSTGKPVPNIIQDRISVKEDKEPGKILEWSGPGTQALNVMLVMDVSGSMADGGKMIGAKEAALAAIDALQLDRDHLGVIAFNQFPMVIQPFGSLNATTRDACRQSIRALQPNGGTNIVDPALQALKTLEAQAPKGSKLVMVMTDGMDERLADPRLAGQLVDEIARLSDQAGSPVITISFGDVTQMDPQSLQLIASRAHGEYVHAPTADDLARIYRSRLKELSDEFRLTYASPFPTADGLPRHIEFTAQAAAGSLLAGEEYQVGPLIAGGQRARPLTANSAASPSGGNFYLKAILFLVSLAGLLAGLVVPMFVVRGSSPAIAELTQGVPGATAAGLSPTSSTAASATGRPVPPPPPPPSRGKAASAVTAPPTQAAAPPAAVAPSTGSPPRPPPPPPRRGT